MNTKSDTPGEALDPIAAFIAANTGPSGRGCACQTENDCTGDGFCEKFAKTSPSVIGLPSDHAGLVAALWQEILDKDDRTSPAEYPDMALITFDEFREAIAAFSAPEAVAGWSYSINYGPEGEENYAYLITPEGDSVANIRTHHAMRIVAALSRAPEAQPEAVAKITTIIARTMAIAAGKNPDLGGEDDYMVWARMAVQSAAPYLAVPPSPQPALALIERAWVFIGSKHAREWWARNDLFQELLTDMEVALASAKRFKEGGE